MKMDTNWKENTDSDKDHFCGRKDLLSVSNYTDLAGSCREAYQASTFSEGIRKGAEDIDRRVEPFGQAAIGTLRSIELLDLVLKHSSNVAGRFACLELDSERVVKKVFLCSSLIFFQGIIENLLELGGRCGRRVCLRHDGGNREGDGGKGRTSNTQFPHVAISARTATNTWETREAGPIQLAIR
jgi:hypothetical protein